MGRCGLAIVCLLALFAVTPASGAPPAAPPEATPAADPLLDELNEEFAAEPEPISDPLESTNRSVLRFNQIVDWVLLDPLTQIYRFIVPEPLKQGLRNALSNLSSPSTTANDLLQREWRDAGVTLARFTVNTTLGVGGLMDVASWNGLPGHSSDFGQTLALAGVESGPYLVLPLFGPNTVRDGFGTLVDMFFRPTTYLLGPGAQFLFNSIQGGSYGIAIREVHADSLRILEESSVDYYAALRNAYMQNREAEIWRRRRHEPEPAP